MVDASDLKSLGLVPWGFDSPRPHQNYKKEAIMPNFTRNKS